MPPASPEAPRLLETYFTPNPNVASPIGLLEVPVIGEDLATDERLAYADVIREALDQTRVDDPQAHVLEALYRGEGIPRELISSVRSAITETHVAMPLRASLYKLYQTFPGEVTLDLELLRQAIEHTTRYGVVLLDRYGLRADSAIEETVQPLFEGRSAELFLSDEERRLAHDLGAGAFAYNMELVWQESDGALEPQLLSRRIHVAVGRTAASGIITHVGTLLSPQHPGRSETVTA